MEDNFVRQGIGGDNSNLFPGLDANTTAALIASEKNWNTDFKGAGVSGMAKNVTGAVDFAANAPALATYVVSYVTNIVTSYLTKATVEMLSIDASQITSKASSLIPNYIISPGKIMGELLKDAEDIMDDINQQNNLNLINNLNKFTNNQVGQLTNKINDKLSYVNSTIADISKYAYMGPTWMKSKIDLATKKIIESSCKEIGKVRDNTKKNIQEQIDKFAEGKAEKLANDINTKVHDATKAQIDEANKKKAEAMTKAKTAITNAKLKLMALIGG